MSTTGSDVKQLKSRGIAITKNILLVGSKVLNFNNKGLSSSNNNGDIEAK